MDLILWRHADAEEGMPDLGRALTVKGHKQARRMALWLNAQLPEHCRILSSPALRATQTTEFLGRKFKVHPGLVPSATPEQLLQAANWPLSKEPVVLVGHQPTLGQVGARLLSGTCQDWAIKKGNVWWIVQRDTEDGPVCTLRAVLAPELVPK